MGVCVKNDWLASTPNTRERDAWIRRRAIALWEQAGRSGGPDDYRFQAELEFELDASDPRNETAGTSGETPSNPEAGSGSDGA